MQIPGGDEWHVCGGGGRGDEEADRWGMVGVEGFAEEHLSRSRVVRPSSDVTALGMETLRVLIPVWPADFFFSVSGRWPQCLVLL